MSRATKEWIGKSDNARIPPRVQLRVFERAGKRCQGCGIDLSDGRGFELDHVVALINGGENRETNLQALCRKCHKMKTMNDVWEKSITAKKKAKHHGVKRKGSGFKGWRRFNGEVVWK